MADDEAGPASSCSNSVESAEPVGVSDGGLGYHTSICSIWLMPSRPRPLLGIRSTRSRFVFPCRRARWESPTATACSTQSSRFRACDDSRCDCARTGLIAGFKPHKKRVMSSVSEKTPPHSRARFAKRRAYETSVSLSCWTVASSFSMACSMYRSLAYERNKNWTDPG